MSNVYFKIILFFIFIFITFILFSEEIKIKNEVIVYDTKIYLSDLIETENIDFIEKDKNIQLGYAPAIDKIINIKGEYIKIKIKQMKYLKYDEIEKLVFPEKVVIKRESKEEKDVISIDKENEKKGLEEKKEEINFKDRIYVSEEKIYLSDFMEINNNDIKEKAKKIVIGFSPKPGETKKIKSDVIKLKLKQLGLKNIDKISLPEEFAVTMEYQTLTKKDILDFLINEINGAYNNENYKVKLEENNIEDINLPQGIYNIILSSNPGETKKIGDFKVECIIEVNGEIYKKIIVNGKTGIMKSVYVALDDISKGSSFSEEKIEKKELIFFSVEELKKEIVLENVKNKLFKRNVKKGEILDDSMFEKRKVFKKNDNVIAKVILDGVIVTNILKAMEDGYEGEIVNLVNPVSKKIVNGIVQEDGSVVIIIK